MKTKISSKILYFLKNSLILVVIQTIIAGIVWFICDIIGVYLTTYYIGIDQIPPFVKEWRNGILDFFKYIITTFIGIIIFWGLSFIINSILYLKYENLYCVILFILSVSFLYTYIIFIHLLNIYFWNELFRLMYSTIIILYYLTAKNNY